MMKTMFIYCPNGQVFAVSRQLPYVFEKQLSFHPQLSCKHNKYPQPKKNGEKISLTSFTKISLHKYIKLIRSYNVQKHRKVLSEVYPVDHHSEYIQYCCAKMKSSFVYIIYTYIYTSFIRKQERPSFSSLFFRYSVNDKSDPLHFFLSSFSLILMRYLCHLLFALMKNEYKKAEYELERKVLQYARKQASVKFQCMELEMGDAGVEMRKCFLFFYVLRRFHGHFYHISCSLCQI